MSIFNNESIFIKKLLCDCNIVVYKREIMFLWHKKSIL